MNALSGIGIGYREEFADEWKTDPPWHSKALNLLSDLHTQQILLIHNES